MSRHVHFVSISQWRAAWNRADRVLAATLALMIALTGTIVGATSHRATSLQPVSLLRTVVEYVRLPIPPEHISAKSSSINEVSSRLLAQHRCLAEAMYYEARGEGEAGEKAVAEVVFHRLQQGGYGRSICSVVYEGAPKFGCQFSFACDGSRSRPKSTVAWRSAEVLAARILAGELPLPDETEGAMNYHAVYVHPIWAAKLVRTTQIGKHIFYRRDRTSDFVAPATLRSSVW